MYRDVSWMYLNVSRPLRRIHSEYVQNTLEYIKHNVSLSQTRRYENTFWNTSEYAKIQYFSKIHRNTAGYIRILFFGYNVLNTQATEHRGASPPPNEGFVQHAARDT